jgi:hypothetical protein
MDNGMSLRAASAVLDPPASDRAPERSDLEFQRDLLAPFGHKLDEERFRLGPQVTHRDLTDLLLADADVRASRPQLVIVTQALPDVLPFTAVAPYLAHRLESSGLCFGVAQQGLAAPFTALRIADAYYRAGQCSEAVITVLEQTTLPMAMPLVDDTPLVDSAAALVLGPGAGPRLAEVASGDCAAELIRARIGEADALTVLGPWVEPVDLGDRPVHRVPPGSYCTSVWLALAAHWPAWQQDHSAIVLCDTDPRTGRSHIAAFQTARGTETRRYHR